MSLILLIDDDDSLRKMLRLTLTHFGHSVQEACNGKEAMLMFAKTPPDLVLTDLVMPEQEGIETITAIRRISPKMKIIAMSGGGRGSATDYLQMAKALGANCVLEKPFSNEALASAISETLAA